MTLSLIIFFILIGLLFLLVEILVTPGIVLGVVGLGFISYGIFQTYEAYGSSIGNMTLLGVAALTITVVLMALKSGVWSKIASKDTIGSKAKEDVEQQVRVGDQGKALSAMRPSGTALINNIKIEASTEGELIDAGMPLEVIRIEQNKVFIKKT